MSILKKLKRLLAWLLVVAMCFGFFGNDFGMLTAFASDEEAPAPVETAQPVETAAPEASESPAPVASESPAPEATPVPLQKLPELTVEAGVRLSCETELPQGLSLGVSAAAAPEKLPKEGETLFVYDLRLRSASGEAVKPASPLSLILRSAKIAEAQNDELSLRVYFFADKLSESDPAPEAQSVAVTRIYGNELGFLMSEHGVYAVQAVERPASETQAKDTPYSYEAYGAYTYINISGTYRSQEPETRPAFVEGSDTLTVLEAWTVDNIKNKTSLTLTAELTALPELEEGESLAFYSLTDSALSAEPLKTALTVGDELSLALDRKGPQGLALVKLAAPAPGGDDDDELPVDGTVIWANEDVYLTGKMPAKAVVVAEPVTVSIEGEEVLLAYDITIYANEKQREKGKPWQPADKKVQVHFRNEALANRGKVSVYHLADAASAAEYVDTVKVIDGEACFEAASFSVYAVTGVIEKTVSIDGNTYKITVTYDRSAQIPDGAELSVTEKSAESLLDEAAEALHWTAEDTVYYTKFLDISIVKDGAEIEPAAPVEVRVELMDVEEGAEALQVVHFGPNGAEELSCTATAEGVVTFETGSFSSFGFGSILRTLLSWTTELATVAVKGFLSSLTTNWSETQVSSLTEGLEALEAYNVTRSGGLLSGLSGLFVSVSLKTAVALGAREKVSVLGLNNGVAGDTLLDSISFGSEELISLGEADGFAIVKDSGYRHLSFALENVSLDGMMPLGASAAAEDVAESIAADETSSVLAAFDINILDGEEEYQPDEAHPIAVSIFSEALTAGQAESIELWHIRDDGEEERLEDFTVEDGRLSFSATGFSTYVVKQIILEKTIEASDGYTYKITVTYDEDAGLPAEAELDVREVDDAELLRAAAETVGSETEALSFARLFDISIVKDGVSYQPNEKVTVSVELLDAQTVSEVQVVHFESETKAEKLSSLTEGNTVTFETEGFSVFSFLDFSVFDKIVSAVLGETEGVLYENDDIILTGKMPSTAIVDAERVEVEVEGQQALVAYDIKIYAHPFMKLLGVNWQPTAGAIQVTLKSDVLGIEDGPVNVYHMADSEAEPELVAEDLEIEDGSVTFDAESFSIYPITPGSGNNARIAYRFWYYNAQTRQYEEIGTQFYRYKDVQRAIQNGTRCVRDPGIPGFTAEEMVKIFKGWYKGSFTGTVPALDTVPTTIEQLNDELEAKQEEDFVEGTYIDIFAQLNLAYYITYTDVNTEAIRGTDLVLKEEEGDTFFTVRSDITLTRYQDNLKGWRKLEDITDPESTLYVGGSDYTITESLTLAPVIEGGYWLVFNDNDLVDDGTGNMVSGGASYTAPAFYLNNSSEQQVTVRPAMDPEWVGYSFEGWYVDAACTEEFSFGNVLTRDTTVYAKWAPAENSYTVIVWKQRASDKVDALDMSEYDAWLESYQASNAGASAEQIAAAWDAVSKHYDYDYSRIITTKANGDRVMTGDYIILDPSYTTVYGADGSSTASDKKFFVYNQEATTQYVVVKASGGSVFNIYYDRVPVTMNFYVWDRGYVYTETTSDEGTQYGIVGNEYVELERVAGEAYTYTYSYSPAYNATTGDTGTQYGIIDGEYRELDRVGSYGFSYHPYISTTGTTGTQYALIGGEYVQLSRVDHAAYTWTPQYTFTQTNPTSTNTTYYGLVDGLYVPLTYNRSDYYCTMNGVNTAVPSTTTRYVVSTDTNNQTTYGIVDGALVQLTRAGNMGNRYWTYNGERYNGTRYRESTNRENTYVFADGSMLPVTYDSTYYWYSWSYNGTVYHSVQGTTGYYGSTITVQQRSGSTCYTRANYNGAALADGTTRYKLVNGSFVAATDNEGTQYYFDGTGYVELTRGGTTTYTWEYTDSSGTHPWEGTRYQVSSGTNTSYTGHRYTRGGGSWWEYSYEATEAQTNGLYGVDDRGGHVALIRSATADSYEYFDSSTGERYTGTRYYIPNNNPVSYTGTRYTMPGGVPHVTTEDAASGLYGEDPNGVYRELNGTPHAQNLWTYEDPDTGETKYYTATRYIRTDSQQNSWQLYRSYTGLYASTYGDNGYVWPTEYDWYDTGYGTGGNATGGTAGGTGGTRTTFTDAFIIGDGSTSENFYGRTAAGGTKSVLFNKQNLDLTTYTTANTVQTSGNGTFSITDKYEGFKPVAYSVNGGATKVTLPETPNSQGYYATGISYNSTLDIYFDRKINTLSFSPDPEGGAATIDYRVPYGQSLESYANQSAGEKPGYYLEGWFADEEYQVPFDFSQTMPDANKLVYAKWTMERVRVIFIPNGDNVYIDPSQAMSFRVNYNESINGAMLEAATRPGYILSGWYSDPDFQNKYIFGSPVNTDTTGVDKTYRTAAKWAATRENYGDNAEKYQNVRGVLVLYAKWVQDTSQSGVSIVYDPGAAALYDGLGYVSTLVPVDPRLYPDNSIVTVGAAPTNYSPLYVFDYWEIIDSEGNVVTVTNAQGTQISRFEPGFTFNVDWVDNEHAYELIYVENTDQLLIKTIRLRAHYHKSADASEYYTAITYDGDRFDHLMYSGGEKTLQGRARDGSERITVTLDKEINETIFLPGETDFYLDGYTLVGWSFFEGSYEEQLQAAEEWNEEHPEDPLYTQLVDLDNDGTPETTVHFAPNQKVAADNLYQNAPNDEENTLYAMWIPKTYTVTVKQVVEDGVKAKNNNSELFRYQYKSGVENSMPTGTRELSLDGTAQQVFTTLSHDASTLFHYYELVGHVFNIQGPTISDDKDFAVRVSATVLRDDGTLETLDLNELGNYEILGDVTITYTYSLKVQVTLEKRDLANNGLLQGSKFTLTPIEWDSVNLVWRQVGTKIWTYDLSASTSGYFLLQEGVYRVDEIQAPTDYAAMGEALRLTVVKDGAFSLTTMNGAAVSDRVAKLSGSDSHTLTVYDRPIRDITIKKTVQGTDVTANAEYTFLVQLSLEGSELKSYDTVGSGLAADITNSGGVIEFSLRSGDEKTLHIPWGSVITVSENEYAQFSVSASSQQNVADEETDTDRIYRCTVDNNDTVTFTNTNRLLTVTKTVTGAFGERSKFFAFTLTGVSAGKRYYFQIDGSNQSMFAAADGSVSFMLKHGQTMTIPLPDGAYTVEEEAAEHYITSLAVNGGASLNQLSYGLTLSESSDAVTVAYTNYRPPVAPTGIEASPIGPFALMLGFGALLGLLALLLRRRRREDEDEIAPPVSPRRAVADGPGEAPGTGSGPPGSVGPPEMERPARKDPLLSSKTGCIRNLFPNIDGFLDAIEHRILPRARGDPDPRGRPKSRSRPPGRGPRGPTLPAGEGGS